MNRDDFERLQRRFGKDWTTWPPPYRQEARALLEAADADDDLDSLLLAAIDVPGDEGALARTVLSRIEGSRGVAGILGGILRPVPTPVLATCLALVLLTAAAIGYRFGDGDTGVEQDMLLALAVGDAAGLGEVMEGFGSDGGEL